MDEQENILRLMVHWGVRQSDIDEIDISNKSTWKKDYKVVGLALSQYNMRNRQEGEIVSCPRSTTFERFDGGIQAGESKSNDLQLREYSLTHSSSWKTRKTL